MDLPAGVTRDRIVYGTAAGELKATAVDPSSLEPQGTPIVLARQVGYDTRAGFVSASLSVPGVLAYRLAQDPQSEFVWMDRSGRRTGRLGEPGPWHNFDLSADGTRVIAATCGRGGTSSSAGTWIPFRRQQDRPRSSRGSPTLSGPRSTP